ncbi:MAG: 2-amino-4-hydroxy-6-hydroxymethyldihydropteridine diphosphokinase [Gallionellales bacterium RIFCSPLOWO2_02_60_31]|nr:MAG: 2-amino-4-hydroxy-6-hydroxymethyldihydropteridine diphosphokinase [Gallionellales bacterium RIFCSPLOWO2_02_60_31]
MPHIAFIGLGSNLEDPRSQLQRAFDELDGLPETRLVARSSLYRSAPLGYPDQPEFVNAVAEIATALTPQTLLQALLQIEHRHGRERTFRNAPRTLDLDMLLYDDTQLHEHGLTIPHPQMHLRAFVLQPLLEIAPDAGIPGMGRARQALQNCTNQMLEKLADAA